MRLLAITHTLRGNGTARTLAALLEHIAVARADWHIDVIHPGNELLCEPMRRVGIGFLPGANAGRYDLALVWSLVAVRALARLAPHVPVVLAVHEGLAFRNDGPVPPPELAALMALARRVVLLNAWQRDAVFARELAGIAQDRVSLLPNGWPPAAVATALAPQPRAPGIRRVICIASLTGRKRQQDLIAALALLGRPDVELVLVGASSPVQPMSPELQQMLDSGRYPFVRLTGELPPEGVQSWLDGSDVFCLPSADEAQPLGAFEAAAAGVPLVLADLPTYAGLWRDGHDALMHPAGNVAALAERLGAVLGDAALRARLAANARATAMEHPFAEYARRWTALLGGTVTGTAS